jgi:hypothetical protein
MLNNICSLQYVNKIQLNCIVTFVKLLYVSLISGVSTANVVGALLNTDYRFRLWRTVYDQVSATPALLC